jgi:cubilin
MKTLMSAMLVALAMVAVKALNSTGQSNCNGTLTEGENSGVITSPGWPSNYSNNVSCQWELLLDPGQYIGISFIDMDTQRFNDYIGIEYEDSNGDMQPEDDFSGSGLPDPLVLPSNRAVVTFHSDGANTGRGFALAYKSAPKSQIFTEETGVISSPGWPSSYNDNVDFEWLIILNPGLHISIRFTDMDIEECCDYVEIEYLDPAGNGTTTKQFSGTNLPTPFFIESHMALVRFHSDDTVVGNGFSLIYHSGVFFPQTVRRSIW